HNVWLAFVATGTNASITTALRMVHGASTTATATATTATRRTSSRRSTSGHHTTTTSSIHVNASPRTRAPIPITAPSARAQLEVGRERNTSPIMATNSTV